MYEGITVEAIKERILGRLSTDLQTREGSYTNDIISAVAAEIAEAYHSMDAMIPSFYLDETSGAYIDQQAAVVGIVRRSGTKATCVILFTGADDASVPKETPFFTDAGLEFRLQETITIVDGAASGILEAAEPGDSYNIGAGEITQTMRNYTGIGTYSNQAASGGSDRESDASLLERYHARMQQAATSGNPYHYQQWARSVDGVGASRVIAKWNGAGTVKVIITDPDAEPADAETVNKCAAYIAAQRPIGADVTVVAATAVDLSVAASVTIDGSTTKAAVKAAFDAALKLYLAGLVKATYASNLDADLDAISAATYTVSYNRISALLLTIPGVIDHTSLTINGGTANVSIAADAVPVLAEVSAT